MAAGRVDGAHGLDRAPALDGLRAVAVTGVILFHLGLSWVPGGMLGVDVFFVLSGFLITGLVVEEWRRTGRISMRRFWGRRARRLLPGLLLTLVVVVVLTAWLAEPGAGSGLGSGFGELPAVRDDALATLLYVANWHALAADQGYFEAFAAPSPLLHTWSLGIEEQFYVVWPLLAVLALSVRRSPRLLLALSGAGAAASAAWMARVDDLNRAYYGTDTRAQALLVGAALALVLHRTGRSYTGSRWDHRPASPVPRVVPAAGVAGLGALVAVALTTEGTSRWLYQGGFLLVALCTAAVLAAAVLAPAGALARLLSARPLPYLGRISYGLYLWHWPVVVFLSPGRTGLDGWPLAAVRVAVTLLTAAGAYALVERPVHERRLRVPRPALVVPAGVAALAAALLVAPLPSPRPALLDAAPPLPPPAPPALSTESAPPSPGPPTSSPPTTPRASSPATAASPPPLATPPPPPPPAVLVPAVTRPGPLRVMLVGDSVAHSLGFSLERTLDPAEFVFTNQGFLGCGIARGGATSFNGYVQPEICLSWPQRWQELVDRFRPDVTLVLIGRWEVFDRVRDGRWQRLGEPAFDSYLVSELDLAVRVLTSRGGRVAFLDPPCNNKALADAIGPNRIPPDDATRVDRLIELTAGVVADYPATTRLEFDELMCPGGRYQASVGGVPVRGDDGIHLEPLAGRLFVDHLLPDVVAWLRTPVMTSTPRPAVLG